MTNAERKARKFDDTQLRRIMERLVGENADSFPAQVGLWSATLFIIAWCVLLSAVMITSAFIFIAAFVVAFMAWYILYRVTKTWITYPLQTTMFGVIVTALYLMVIHWGQQ